MLEKLLFESISEDHWDAILLSLKEKSNPLLSIDRGEVSSDCILVLGPEALVSDQMLDDKQDYKPLLDMLCEKVLDKMEKDGKISTEEAIPLLSHLLIMEYFKDKYKTNSHAVWFKLYKELYKIENLHPVFYEILPKIPIPIIINTSPDDLLYRAFQKAEIYGTQFKFFDYHSNSEQNKGEATFKEPTLDSPIIYNLFGYAEREDSTVSTPNELLNYVFSILTKGHIQLEPHIYSAIKAAKQVIFLGFDFESWHLKILLRYFEIKKESRATYARPWKLEREETQKYFEKLFNVTFVKDNTVQFINDLYSRCEKDPDIRMRQPSEKKEISLKEELFSHLKKDEFSEVLEKLEKYAKEINDSELRILCINLISRNYNINNDRIKKSVKEEAIEMKINELRDSILKVIKDNNVS